MTATTTEMYRNVASARMDCVRGTRSASIVLFQPDGSFRVYFPTFDGCKLVDVLLSDAPALRASGWRTKDG